MGVSVHPAQHPRLMAFWLGRSGAQRCRAVTAQRSHSFSGSLFLRNGRARLAG